MRSVLQDAKISNGTKKLKCLLDNFKYIMSSSSSKIGYTKLIEMDTETDPNSPPLAFELYMLPPKYQEWVTKEVEESEKVATIQISFALYASNSCTSQKMSTRLTDTRSKEFMCGPQEAKMTFVYHAWKQVLKDSSIH